VEERNHQLGGAAQIGRHRGARDRLQGRSEEDLDKAAEWFTARKLPVSWPNVPFQGRTLRTVDSVGMPIDLYFKMDRVPSMLQKYATYKGARIQRIDHINCFTPDVQKSYDFYNELGFASRDDRDPKAPIRSSGPSGCSAGGSTTILRSPTVRAAPAPRSACGIRNALDIMHTCDVMATSGFSAKHGARPGATASPNAFFLLRARSGRPPRRAVHSELSDRRYRPRGRSAGRSTTPSARRCGDTGAEVVVRGRFALQGRPGA